MRLRQLSHLVALADQGSFARAAQASNLSQPAFSRSIEALEQHLQASLLDRAYGAVHFTQAGEHVLARARALLSEARSMRQEVMQLQNLEAGCLNVGLGPFASVMLGRAALTALVQRHSRLSVNLRMDHTAALRVLLERRELDLFIADTRDLGQWPALQVTPLPHAPVAFFVRARHPLTRLASIGQEQLMAYPLASPSLPAVVAKTFDAWAGGRPLFGVTCDDPATLHHLAMNTRAAILAPNAPAFERETKPLVPLSVAGLETMSTSYGIVTLSGRTPSAAGAAFIRFVLEIMGPAGT